MKSYIDSLEEVQKVKVRYREGKNLYHFQDGNTVYQPQKMLIFPSSLIIKE